MTADSVTPVEARECLLDLGGGVDVEAAGDVHVLEAVGDLEVAAGIDGPDVAGVQPAVGVDRLGGRLGGVIEVSDHHHLAAREDLAGVGQCDLHAREGSTAGVGDGFVVVVGGVHVDTNPLASVSP